MTIARVERPEVEVMFVRAEGGPAGSHAAFESLESRLPTLRGRKFFATCRGDDYRACVERVLEDDPDALALEVGAIPGGVYVREKVTGSFESIPAVFVRLAAEYDEDRSRPCIEFYRRRDEVHLLMPVSE